MATPRPASGGGSGSRPSISVGHAPPYGLVIAHFLAGAVCAAAGGVMLALGFGDARIPLHTETLAIMHLWAAGWLSLTAVGVLIQYLPVTGGTFLLSPRLGWVHLALHMAGVGGLAASFVVGMDGWFGAVSGSMLWCGFALAVVNLGGTLLRARPFSVWRVGALLALLHAIMTPSLGWLLLAFLGRAFFVQHHVALLVAHAHLGLGGWMFGLVIAVGGRLLPMFVVAPEPRPWQVMVALALLQVGLATLGAGVFWPAVGLVGPLVLALAVAWWLVVMLRVFLQRRKRTPDAPLGAAWLAVAMLAAVVAAGLNARLRPGFDGWGLYGLLAIGAGGIMINGLLFRIVPFMARLRAFRKAKGNPAVPALQGVLDVVPYRPQVACLVLGIFGFAIAIVADLPVIETIARVLIAVGTVGFAANLAALVVDRPAIRQLFVRVESAAAQS